MILPASHVDPGQSALTPRDAAAVKDVASPGAAPAAPAENPASVREAVAAINRAAKALTNSVQLSIDSGSGRAIVRVIDSETGALIRQIPTEEALELRRALDRIAGLLIHRTA